VAELYRAQRMRPTWARNGAPYSGAVNWCRGLRERISGARAPPQASRSARPPGARGSARARARAPGPMERVRGMRRAVVESEEGREVAALYERVHGRLAAHEAETVAAWTRQLLETSDQKLKQPLLTCPPARPHAMDCGRFTRSQNAGTGVSKPQ